MFTTECYILHLMTKKMSDKGDIKDIFNEEIQYFIYKLLFIAFVLIFITFYSRENN